MRVLLLILFVAMVAAGCGTAPSKPPSPSQTTPSTPEQSDSSRPTAEQLMQQARAASDTEQLATLIRLIEQWRETHQCTSVLKVVPVLREQALTLQQSQQLTLSESDCLLSQDELTRARQALEKVAEPLSAQFTIRKLQIEAELLAAQERYVEALRTWDTLLKRQPQQLVNHVDTLWSVVTYLPESPSKTALGPTLPWVQLHEALTAQPSNAQHVINQWQERYPSYPLPSSLVSSAAQSLPSPERVAVLLPLSGRLAAQGEAIKHGILAAYMGSELQGQLTFFDSATLNELDLVTLTANYDWLLGPLQKDKVEQLVEQAQTITGTGFLTLNQIDSVIQAPAVFSFALAPEQEAQQLATDLYEQGVRTPQLLASDRSVHQRMAEAFSDQWKRLSEQTPASAEFSDNETMRGTVEAALSVADSENHIDLMQRLVQGREVHTVARSRHDLDALVLFADARQTELMNPIIETSISPFANVIPVYASSQSFSRQLSPNSLRDLQNLEFVDMPWMLPGQFGSLNQDVEQLWPAQADGLRRLFAMGYDALSLLNELPVMRWAPNRPYQGMTGQLTLGPNQQIKRQLSWGRITPRRVERIAARD